MTQSGKSRRLILATCSLLVACGGDGGGGGTPVEDSGVDVTDTGGQTDTGQTDAEETDTAEQPDIVEADTREDGGIDAEPDAEEGPCPGSILCFDERTGNPRDAVCTDNGFPEGSECVEFSDTEACCVPPFACETDDDCENQRSVEEFCADDRYPCVCVVETGECVTGICSNSSECGDGEICTDGLCVAAPDGTGYEARILTAPTTLRSGATLELEAVAVLSSDPNVTYPELGISWSVADGNATIDSDGVLTVGEGAEGTITVEAELPDVDGDTPDSLTLVSLGETTGRWVYVVDEYTGEPVTAGSFDIRGDGEGTTGELDESGAFEVLYEGAYDVHIFPDGYTYASFIAVESDVLLAAIPPNQRAEINEVRDGFVCNTDEPNVTLDETDCGEGEDVPCLCYELENVDVVKGTPDFTNVVADGEVDLSLNGFSIGNSILDLNFDLIVGPEIERIIPEGSPIPLDDAVGIPSGVTLYYNDAPFVDSFIATSPPGSRSVWSVGGTVELSTVLVDLLPSIGGDLEIGPIIAAALPLFDDFYSGVSPRVELSAEGTFPVRDPDIELTVPTQRKLDVAIPALPLVGDGWADTTIVLGGALVVGDGFIPLGVTGGADAVGRGDEPDGFVDGDPDTEGVIDPVSMAMAPLHGSTNTPSTRYMFAHVALTLGDVPNAPREATSGVITLLDAGDSLPDTFEPEFDAFPGLVEGAGWDAESRTLTFGTRTDDPVDMFRVVFEGEQQRRWVVYAPGDVTSTVMPLIEDEGPIDDRTARNRANVVAVTFRDDAVDYESLLDANDSNLPNLYTFIDGFSILGL